MSKLSEKSEKGQFYTTNSTYILDGLVIPSGISGIVEPFAGKGDLVEWAKTSAPPGIPIATYDIDPKQPYIEYRDCLRNPPNYDSMYIITNPPYLARNKNENKEMYDMYNTNDLYKAFILSVCRTTCVGGIFIIPAGFFFSTRQMDTHCRNAFMTKYRITRVKYFEETVFADTTTTVVAISFELSQVPLISQEIEWIFMPSGQTRVFHMSQANKWVVGGEIYSLPVPPNMDIRRHVEGVPLKENEHQTHMTLNALDSGKPDGRIKLEYNENYIYPAKECSRTYATLRTVGFELTAEEQQTVCLMFNRLLEEKREETRSLFLPQFRESKEYARKRIPFELAYTIILHVINYMRTNTK